jgi:hypothetical protein
MGFARSVLLSSEPVSRGALLMLAGAVMFGVVLRVIVAAPLELFSDEALYLWIAYHAPHAFCPHPPGVPLMVRLGTTMAGIHEWGVRLVPQAVAALLPAAAFLLTRAVADTRAAVRAAWGFASVPLFVVVGSMATPDASQLVLWLLIASAVWQAVQSGGPHWWAVAGVFLGIALLVKYIVILILPALALFLLLRPETRHHLRTPGPWVMMVVAAAVFAPPALWSEWQSGWPTLRYHLAERQLWRAPSPDGMARYLGVHLLVYSPVLYAGLVGTLAILGSQVRRAGAEGRRAALLFSMAVVPFALFLVIATITDRRTGREHWDAPACAMLLVAFAVLSGEPGRGSHVRRWLFCASVALAAAWSVGVAVEAHGATVSRLLSAPPLFGTMTGWRDLAAAVDREADALPGDAGRLVVTNRFEPAMQYLAYSAVPGGPRPVKVLDHRSVLDHGVRHLLAAGGLEQHRLIDHPGAGAVFVIEIPRDAAGREDEPARREAKLRRLFQTVTRAPDSGRFALYRCTGLRYPPEN